MPPRIVAADERTIADAAERLRAGRLVAFPTETVYGLGGDATSDRAVARIFEAKGRPVFKPLIVHVSDCAAAESVAVFDGRARTLARRLWPGPITLVLPRAARSPVSHLATAGLDSIAVRIPNHPVALALLAATERPLAAPSANRSGRTSPTRADHVARALGDRVDLILDGGPCAVGLESTVLDLCGSVARILRPGAITPEAIHPLIGGTVVGPGENEATGGRPRAPGALERHYAPSRPLRLNARTPHPGEAFLAFGPDGPESDPALGILNLSPSGDLTEAAANLFAMIMMLDGADYTGIAAMPIPEHGLGIAINDRLRRAARPPGPDDFSVD